MPAPAIEPPYASGFGLNKRIAVAGGSGSVFPARGVPEEGEMLKPEPGSQITVCSITLKGGWLKACLQTSIWPQGAYMEQGAG